MTSPIAGGVDCDLHPAVPHLTSLLPYLNDYWRDQVTTRGMTDLVSGRWASTTAEIVVTQAGIANGLPRQGSLTTTGPGRHDAAVDRGRCSHRADRVRAALPRRTAGPGH